MKVESEFDAYAEGDTEITVFRDDAVRFGLGILKVVPDKGEIEVKGVLDFKLEGGDEVMVVEAGGFTGQGSIDGLVKSNAGSDVSLERGLSKDCGCRSRIVLAGLDRFEAGVLVTRAGGDFPLEVIAIEEVITDADAGRGAVGNIGQLVAVVFELDRADEPFAVETYIVSETEAMVVGILLAVDLAEVAEVIEDELGGRGTSGEFSGGVDGRLLGIAGLEIGPDTGAEAPEIDFAITAGGDAGEQIARELDLFGPDDADDVVANGDGAINLVAPLELGEHRFGRE